MTRARTTCHQNAWRFIDGSNLYHSLDENCNRFDLDFAAFAAKLSNGRTLFRTYYYNVLRDPDRNPQAYQDQQGFLTALYSTPYLDVRLGSSKTRGDVTVEKGVDIMLATDLLRFAWEDLLRCRRSGERRWRLLVRRPGRQRHG